ncbi:MAG: FAD binding domain-containing protein [Hyphomicrobiaceae bacterium]|nr:FAD binding domain-containing protein [Hyphomicrobiaceae bacterium]
MKPVAFDYARPRTIADALELLDARPGAKILAGGQTLGPMLNLRLVQPELLIDITRITDLITVTETDDGVAIGACVTHASIEDGAIGGIASGHLDQVAAGIAYRAVRTRGTIGGSLTHADPAADWFAALLAFGAELEIAGTTGTRRIALDDFVKGAMETDLGPDELVTAVHIRKCGREARHGYHKICRKTGEFAEAIGAVTVEEKTGRFRLVAAGGSHAPVVFTDPSSLFRTADPLDVRSFDVDMTAAALRDAGMNADDYDLRLRAVAMQRAVKEAAQR